MELSFASHAQLKAKGRNFDCSTCPKNVMKLRRCETDRWDYTQKDASFFPIAINDFGSAYGFCPGKTTWDYNLVSLYRLLVLSCETKKLLYDGGIYSQPGWYVELLSWFVTRYDETKFYSRAQAILGSDTKKSKSGSQPDHGRNKGRVKR